MVGCRRRRRRPVRAADDRGHRDRAGPRRAARLRRGATAGRRRVGQRAARRGGPRPAPAGGGPAHRRPTAYLGPIPEQAYGDDRRVGRVGRGLRPHRRASGVGIALDDDAVADGRDARPTRSTAATTTYSSPAARSHLDGWTRSATVRRGRRGHADAANRVDPAGLGTRAVNPPVALTIAGVDSSGGAGVAADLATFARAGRMGDMRCHRGHGAEQPGRRRHRDRCPSTSSSRRSTPSCGDMPVARDQRPACSAPPRWPRSWPTALPRGIPLVVDPVMIATTGAALGDATTASSRLLERATIVTPERVRGERAHRHRRSRTRTTWCARRGRCSNTVAGRRW